jgi:ferredoxin
VIVTEKKPLNEIIRNLRSIDALSVAVIGCGSCATLSETGGLKQVEGMSEALKEHGFKVTFQTVIDSACHERLAARELKKADSEFDSVVVLACGSGVQNIADIILKPVVPGLNTSFIGKTKRPGIFYEYCSACGNCILAETGGICVKTRCPKSVLNGPCGGMHKGKCEVYPDRDCAWIEVWQRAGRRAFERFNISGYHEVNLRPRRKGGPVE